MEASLNINEIYPWLCKKKVKKRYEKIGYLFI